MLITESAIMDNPAPLETQDTVQKSNRFLLPASLLIVLIIVAAVGTYAWYTLYRPCEVNAVEEAFALLVSQMKRYDHAYQFAATASRTALVCPVSMLQQIHMDTQEVLCLLVCKRQKMS